MYILVYFLIDYTTEAVFFQSLYHRYADTVKQEHGYAPPIRRTVSAGLSK